MIWQTAFLAVCLNVWAAHADRESWTIAGNGYPQAVLGRANLTLQPPMSLRLLMPMLLAWNRKTVPEEMGYLTKEWAWYQVLRAMFLWAALFLLASVGGLFFATVAAGLYGLTLRFDYWSNSVEFLGVACVYAAGVHDWNVGYALALGLVLGTGRETLPALGLLLTPFSIVFAAGSGIAQYVIRLFHRPDSKFEFRREEAQYGESQFRFNMAAIRLGGPIERWFIAIYFLVAALAALQQPLLALGLLAVTMSRARINEPRVLTMLVPFAAATLCSLAGN